MRYVRGFRKDVLLTVWLTLPFVFLALIVYGIFSAYSGGRAMDARPVGQGAGDTGGANALGEWLAGHDAEARERVRRDLREGRLIDPVDWPGGIKLTLVIPKSLEHKVWVVLWNGVGSQSIAVITPGTPSDKELRMNPASIYDDTARCSVNIRHLTLKGLYFRGLSGAGIYIARTREVTEKEGRLIDADGNELVPVEIQPVPASMAVEGEPIEVRVEERFDSDLYEGPLIDPLDRAEGIKLVVTMTHFKQWQEYWVFLWAGVGSDYLDRPFGIECGEKPRQSGKSIAGEYSSQGSVTLSACALRNVFQERRPGAGIYIARTGEAMEKDGRLVDANGNELVPVEIRPVPAGSVVEGEPIEVRVRITPD